MAITSEYAPSVGEVSLAKRIFQHEMEKWLPCTELPRSSSLYMSMECAIECSLAKVWEGGRKFQDKETPKFKRKQICVSNIIDIR